MLNVFLNVSILAASIGIDWKILRNKPMKIKMTYGALSGTGFALLIAYGASFALQSPISILVDWLHPITRWLYT